MKHPFSHQEHRLASFWPINPSSMLHRSSSLPHAYLRLFDCLGRWHHSVQSHRSFITREKLNKVLGRSWDERDTFISDATGSVKHFLRVNDSRNEVIAKFRPSCFFSSLVCSIVVSSLKCTNRNFWGLFGRTQQTVTDVGCCSVCVSYTNWTVELFFLSSSWMQPQYKFWYCEAWRG